MNVFMSPHDMSAQAHRGAGGIAAVYSQPRR